ncbi:MAG TPA: GlsB/YeaQ/YmgE family stress response membrane protein [Longimicrobiaceae bacterium]|nr:GlsB/YeaQ/YmgE family stress response membrane protein [Longimicrobiaceae bacterium]
MITIIGWIIFGAVIGFIARFLMPGRDPMGFLMTILLGVAGSVVGGYLAGFIFGGRGTDPAGWIGSIIGALLLLFLYRRFAGPRV